MKVHPEDKRKFAVAGVVLFVLGSFALCGLTFSQDPEADLHRAITKAVTEVHLDELRDRVLWLLHRQHRASKAVNDAERRLADAVDKLDMRAEQVARAREELDRGCEHVRVSAGIRAHRACGR